MRNRTRLARLFLFVILACICAGLMFGAASFDLIPRVAGEVFGTPAPGLNPLERVWLSAQLLYYETSLLKPRDPNGTVVNFAIGLGDSVPVIAQRLYREGLIADPDAFRVYLVYSGLDSSVQAGKYQLSPAMNAVEIAQKLQNASPTQTTIRILPGWRIEEVAATLPVSGVQISSDEFVKAAIASPPLALPDGSRTAGSMEGFLFPDTYQVSRSISPAELVNLFGVRFKQNLSPEMVEGIRNQKLTIAQAVILASMVQREAAVSDEMPLIASVFYNRLAVGMKLESDPTVQYGLGYNAEKGTWWTNPLSLQDLKFNSAYNTYLRAGLPPGPICNPGIEALRSVASPAKSTYLFFRAKCDGSRRHSFAETFGEHLQNACP